MIRTVIFDLGGVIVPLDFPQLYARISERCGVPVSDIPTRIGATGLVPMLETGQVSAEEFTTRISAELGLTLAAGEFPALWSSLFSRHTLIPESLLLALKGRYRLLLLSNTNSLHFEMIRDNYPLIGHFDDYILSYKVGAMKPSPLMYEAAISKAGCHPSECFFTDDIEPYVAGARQAGIDAVQFKSYDQIVGELASRGIAV